MGEVAIRKCYYCGDDVENRVIDWVEYVNGIKVVISDVPAAVCVGCGERYVHSSNSEMIDRELQKYYEQELVLEVNLKAVRTEKGLTQEDVAGMMGFSKSRYADIEKIKKVPSVFLALKLAGVLDCNVNDIFSLKRVSKKDIVKNKVL